MERKLARIETILSLDPIPGADLIEAATVGGWKVVVKKGAFTVNSLALFMEIDSLLPFKSWNAFLFKDKRELYRLRSVKLRGQISQGLLVPIAEVPELIGRDWIEGDDVTGLLEIKKWEPNIPANLAGQVKGNFPAFLRKTDEERLQNAKSVLDEIRGIPVYVATKMDGTSFTAYRHEGVFGVCSRNLELREEGGDDYWAMAKKLNLPARLPEGYAISAELCGPGIQGNKMGLFDKHLYVFNVWHIPTQQYLDMREARQLASTWGLSWVPVRETGTFDYSVDQWLSYADFVRYDLGAQAEGIVVRPLVETYSTALRGRLSFKVISNAFLLTHKE